MGSSWCCDGHQRRGCTHLEYSRLLQVVWVGAPALQHMQYSMCSTACAVQHAAKDSGCEKLLARCAYLPQTMAYTSLVIMAGCIQGMHTLLKHPL
jgi:hypothetical protein